WDDLTSSSSVLSYVIEGNAPNRIAVVQWHGSHHFGGSGDALDFQIWLFEGGAAQFEVHYGMPIGMTPTTYSFTAGVEDPTATRGAEFLMCSPNCLFADVVAQANLGFRGLQDAGNDLIAQSVELATTADPIHVYQNIPFAVNAAFASYHGQPIGPFNYTYNL